MVYYVRCDMKKSILIFTIIISLFVISSKITVLAADDSKEINYLEDKGDYANCDGMITQEGLDMIKEVLNWIRIIAPVLLIIFVAIDFGTAVISQDRDALSKAGKKVVPRMIATGLLFFVPTIVRAILSLDGIADSIIIPDDPLCNTMKEEINLENKLSI